MGLNFVEILGCNQREATEIQVLLSNVCKGYNLLGVFEDPAGKKGYKMFEQLLEIHKQTPPTKRSIWLLLTDIKQNAFKKTAFGSAYAQVNIFNDTNIIVKIFVRDVGAKPYRRMIKISINKNGILKQEVNDAT